MKRNRPITPAIPYLFISDTTGAQAFTNVGAWHTWDTIMFKTSEFIYLADDNRVLINKQGSGFYEITFEASFYVSSKLIRQVKTDLYKNGVIVANSHTHTTVSGSTDSDWNRDHQTIHYVIYLEKGDTIQVKTQTDTETVYTDPASSRLMINFIPLRGWNNSNGGRLRMRGEVAR